MDNTATWVDSFSHFLSNNRNSSNEQIIAAFLECRFGCSVNRDAVRRLVEGTDDGNVMPSPAVPQSSKHDRLDPLP